MGRESKTTVRKTVTPIGIDNNAAGSIHAEYGNSGPELLTGKQHAYSISNLIRIRLLRPVLRLG